jgi:CHAD domain-containing protein
LEAWVAHRAARARTRIEDAGALYLPEQLHAVRIAVKQLRYSAELLAEVTDTRIAPTIAELKAAQDLLGRLHDLDVLLVHAREAQASFRVSDLVTSRRMDSVIQVLDVQCRQLHARYVRERAGLLAMTNRMAASAPESPRVAERAVG